MGWPFPDVPHACPVRPQLPVGTGNARQSHSLGGVGVAVGDGTNIGVAVFVVVSVGNGDGVAEFEPCAVSVPPQPAIVAITNAAKAQIVVRDVTKREGIGRNLLHPLSHAHLARMIVNETEGRTDIDHARDAARVVLY